MVFDLAGLLRALTDAEVEFVVIGGIAVAAHAVVRATEDVDVVPRPTAPNLTRLLDLLTTLERRLLLNPARGIDQRVRTAVLGGRNLTVSTRFGDLDVVQRLPGVPSGALRRRIKRRACQRTVKVRRTDATRRPPWRSVIAAV